MRRLLIGLAGGFALGYLFVRSRQAIVDLRRPLPELPPDPVAYGRLRRALMLAGIARSLTTLGATAYGLGPAFEPRPGARESRPRRLTLVAAALVASSLVDLPLDYVEEHVLERRYQLSKQRARDWLLDRSKSLGVSLAVALPLVELLAAVVERAPRTWPALATAGSFPLLVLANVVAPTYIAPLFNRFEPLVGDLEQEVRTLAERYGAGDAAILRIDMSRQTEKANAYVTGLFGTRRIVIGDTLLDRFAPRETLFVVAHELGHYVARDVWRAVALGTAGAGVVFFGGRALAERPERSLATAAGLARLGFASSLLALGIGPLLAAFSRSRERVADRFALAATNDAQAGIAAFTRLRERNLAEDAQPRWMELLFSSHPSMKDRIATLRSVSAEG